MGELKDVLAPAFAIVARTMYGWLLRGKGVVQL